MANGDHKGFNRSLLGDREKVIKLVESGKVDKTNPSIIDNYLKIKLSEWDLVDDVQGKRPKTIPEKLDDIVGIGVPPELPIMMITEKIISRMNDSLAEEGECYYHQQFHDDGIYAGEGIATLAEMSEILDKYDSTEARKLLMERANIQAFGDKAVEHFLVMSSMSRYGDYRDPESIKKQIERAKEGINFLRKLGYEPLKNGVEPVFAGADPFCESDKVIGVQKLAKELGLITEDTVDAMYRYKFNKLNKDKNAGDMPILEGLKCSGKDEFALFWEKRSEETGEDELSKIAKEAREHHSGSIIVEMAREFSESEDQESDPMQTILRNPDMLSGPDRGFVIALNAAMKNVASQFIEKNPWYNMDDPFYKNLRESDQRRSTKEIIEKLLRLNQKIPGGYEVLFDENGVSEMAKEAAIFSYDYRSTVKEFDPNWASKFSSGMKEVIDSLWDREGLISEHPDLMEELSPRRRKLVELIAKHPGSQLSSLETDDLKKYFDKDGNIKPELAKRLFSGSSYVGGRKVLCSTPEISAALPLVQQKYLDTVNRVGRTDRILSLSDSEIAKYFDEEGPKPEFWQAEFEAGEFREINLYSIKAKYDDGKTEIDYSSLGLSLTQESIMKLFSEDPWFAQDLRDIIKSKETEKYFDENGTKPEFWQLMFSRGNLEGILKHVSKKATVENVSSDSPFGYSRKREKRPQEDLNFSSLSLSENQEEALRVYSELEDGNDKSDFCEFVSEDCNEIPISRIRIAPQVLKRLGLSNSSEIAKHRSAFARQLLRIELNNDEKMFESLEQIEDVFIHNNLPFVGKAFLSFQILHPSASLDSDFDFSESSKISPSLKDVPNSPEQAKSMSDKAKNRETIIFSDLLKASFGSNNRSIRDYLNSLKEGQELIDELSSGELSWDELAQAENDDAPDEIRKKHIILEIFAQHINTMYNNTEAGKKNPHKLSGDLEQDLTELIEAFSPTERHKLSDRVVRNFAYFAGVKDLDSAVLLLGTTAKNADTKNREAIKNGFKLEKGDLVKGIGKVRYLTDILQNGSVAKEFLGDSAGSDLTPLDTDLSIVLKTPENMSEGLKDTEAYGYGPVWLVLKGDENRQGENRLSITRRSPKEDEQKVEAPNANEKLEAFYTGKAGDSHYGIRTGFASSEIDYFIVGSEDINGTPISKVIGMEIALNGFYIPVVDMDSGKIIFTPEDYDEIREKMSGLSHYETGDYHFAKESELNLGSVVVDGTQIDSISQITSQLSKNETEVRKKHVAIDSVIDLALQDIGGLTRKGHIDGDLTEGFVELIDTGSTGRFDNAPGSGDFDYLMRLDKSIKSDPEKLSEVSKTLLARFGKTEHEPDEVLPNGDLRLKNVHIDGLNEPVDIDISFVQKTNKVQYSTDMALVDRLETIRKQSPEKYKQVIANIIFAKKFLKAARAYKPNRGDKPQGGLGGAGVENWILQNGGSFLSAARSFMAVAEKFPDFEDFCKEYTVWDFGENHMFKGKKQHDNFVADNMSKVGYDKMKGALAEFLAQQEGRI